MNFTPSPPMDLDGYLERLRGNNSVPARAVHARQIVEVPDIENVRNRLLQMRREGANPERQARFVNLHAAKHGMSYGDMMWKINSYGLQAKK